MLFAGLASSALSPGAEVAPSVMLSLDLPVTGAHTLRVLSPTVLELTVITGGGPVVPGDHTPTPPPPVPELTPADFNVTVAPPGGNSPTRSRAVSEVGFRRRPVYAPLKQRDLRIGNYVYLRLAEALVDGDRVSVTPKPGQPLFGAAATGAGAASSLTATAAPDRVSPAIHVNQVGYAPEAPKLAMIGYFLGSLRELDVPEHAPFEIVGAHDGKVAFRGQLSPRPDRGMPYPWYRQVRAADFSALHTPGVYRLRVAGLGASYPFRIDEGVPAAFARTYALGLYHQRCGAENALPFTRFVHAPCHTAEVEIPAGDVRALPGFDETAPDADLFPFVRKGTFAARGGHHDAGDYSKYTINSAGFVHHLMFAVDSLAGVAALDNLGLPESGDGVSDVLQLAKWESDFLAQLQDEDGGFYFLVYPRARRYEQDVLPDHGDPQIVWPKNTAATAAAVAALAQCASSPLFRKHFAADAKRYLEIARRGWAFLRAAEEKFGAGTMYRKFTHYGDDFGDADEITWAACELFLATGEPEFERVLRAQLDPRDPETRRWGWRRLTEGYGRAIRSYAFAARSGRVPRTKLDRQLLLRCEDELIACAEDWLRAARESAYGTSYPEPTKRVSGGGWYFATDQAFDLAVACQLGYPEKADRRPAFRDAVLSNLNYDAGCNPVSVCFVTGMGWRRQLEIVHQYAQNDRRVLPPSGIPLGSIVDGFGWTANYKGELGAACFPLDGDKTYPYPILDRWGDAFNLEQEFVIVNQARALATAAWLMAQTPLKTQPWRAASAKITGVPANAAAGAKFALQLEAEGLDLSPAQIVWEGRDLAPVFTAGAVLEFIPRQAGAQWIEAEAMLPDGRRVFAVAQFSVAP